MQVSVFGLGYVGSVTAACLAKSGHRVCGVDPNPDKVAMINAGRSPVVEKGLVEAISEAGSQGRLRATMDPFEAVQGSEVSLVCVGTPSNGNGSLSLQEVKAVSQEIGKALERKAAYHCVVFRSTVLPGTTREVLVPILCRTSGRVAHRDFDVCFNPEFLREGSSVEDFLNPTLTVIGQVADSGGDRVGQLYTGINAPVCRTSYEIAETVKYASNAFHAVKVAFANEVGTLCKGLGIDSHRVMELFCLDHRLNISSAYLKPGFAFGGSCLPKDLRALLHRANMMDLKLPLLASILESNRLHVQRAIDWILSTRRKRIGILGLSFKPGTDDLRESPVVSLVETLAGKGCRIRIYDAEVSLARIFGSNRAFIEREIPHISALMCDDLEEVVRESEVIVVCKADERFRDALRAAGSAATILDLVRTFGDEETAGNCHGIGW